MSISKSVIRFQTKRLSSEMTRVDVREHSASWICLATPKTVQNMRDLIREYTYTVKVNVFEVEGVDVAWEEALSFSCVRQSTVSNGFEGGWEGRAYPRQVRQMLIRISAPHPAMRKTPRGGTVGGVSEVSG